RICLQRKQSGSRAPGRDVEKCPDGRCEKGPEAIEGRAAGSSAKASGTSVWTNSPHARRQSGFLWRLGSNNRPAAWRTVVPAVGEEDLRRAKSEQGQRRSRTLLPAERRRSDQSPAVQDRAASGHGRVALGGKHAQLSPVFPGWACA